MLGASEVEVLAIQERANAGVLRSTQSLNALITSRSGVSQQPLAPEFTFGDGDVFSVFAVSRGLAFWRSLCV
jgi:hypothetical protein